MSGEIRYRARAADHELSPVISEMREGRVNVFSTSLDGGWALVRDMRPSERAANGILSYLLAKDDGERLHYSFDKLTALLAEAGLLEHADHVAAMDRTGRMRDLRLHDGSAFWADSFDDVGQLDEPKTVRPRRDDVVNVEWPHAKRDFYCRFADDEMVVLHYGPDLQSAPLCFRRKGDFWEYQSTDGVNEPFRLIRAVALGDRHWRFELALDKGVEVHDVDTLVRILRDNFPGGSLVFPVVVQKGGLPGYVEVITQGRDWPEKDEVPF